MLHSICQALIFNDRDVSDGKTFVCLVWHHHKTPLLWFESYLSDRSIRVSWRGEVSKSQLLATGVPQGSVLGPLIFSIYMSSLGSVIQKHGFSYLCYADDTQLYFSFQPDDPTVTARIAACLSDISSWMMDHTVAYKCKTNHNSENKITNYKCKCKYKKQNNNSENTTTIPKTL